jgi:hypothetical protein
MKRAIALAVLVSVAGAQDAPKPAPRIATGAWAGALREHPRLFGPRAHLQALAKANAAGYREIKTIDDLPADGIEHAVDGLEKKEIDRHIAAAMRHVARGVTNRHQDTWVWMTEVAMTFDFFHDAIAPRDRQTIVDWINGHLGKYTDDENAFHNSTLSKILCYLRCAYATWGENPRAKELRDYALVKLYEGKVLPVLLEFGAGGGFTECGWYARGSLWHLVQALELARRVEKHDGFAKAPAFFYARLAYEMFQPLPGKGEYGSERFAVEGDGAQTYGGHCEYPRLLRTVLAQYFRGSELARAVANRKRRGSNPQTRMMDWLYEEEADAPLDLASFPLAHHAAGIGRVYARSDWSDEATWMRFECGDLFAHHQHYEVGNFEIVRHERLATESGEYEDYTDNHSVNWLIRTIAHNCVLVKQPDETWKDMRDGGRHATANDGGQAKKWAWVVDTVDEWKAKREQFERGDIVAYENRPSHLYVAADCTKAYAPSKLALWIRQIVFVRPHLFVIFDRVVSTRAEFPKTWLLHCRNKPEISNGTTVVSDGKGRLTVQTLLPEKRESEAIEGYTYGGQTFDPKPNPQTPLAAKWRVEVRPKEARVEDLFLHVLSTDAAPQATLVREGVKVGVKVGDVQVMFDGKVGGTFVDGGRKVELKEGVKRGKFE